MREPYFALDTLNETTHTTRMVKPKRTYRSLQEYLDRTGTQQKTLARRARISEPFMSQILRGSRRCSLENALRLWEVTGVPVEKLTRWPRVSKPLSSDALA